MNSGTSAEIPKLPDYYYSHKNASECVGCGNPDFKKHREIKHFGFEFVFHRCDNCGVIKQIPMPNEAFFDWFFNSDLFFSAKSSDSNEIWGFYDYFKDESSRLKTSRYRHKKLSKVLGWDKRNISLMKIGPSTGTFLHAAQQAGHEVRGCDVSDRFAGYAMDNYHVKIDIGRYENLGYQNEQFDAIMLLNVIENVPNLSAFIASIRRTLKIGGHFVLNHVEMKGNLIEKLQGDKYFIYRPPICYVFKGDNLNHVLSSRGFKLVTKKRDIRFMHLEKITTLLRWRWALKLAQALGIARMEFPIWAYPSWISVYERTE